MTLLSNTIVLGIRIPTSEFCGDINIQTTPTQMGETEKYHFSFQIWMSDFGLLMLCRNLPKVELMCVLCHINIISVFVWVLSQMWLGIFDMYQESVMSVTYSFSYAVVIVFCLEGYVHY